MLSNRTTIALLLALGLSLAAPACAATDLDRATRAYLEGVWQGGKPPSKPACVDIGDSASEIEFEFQRTGGRILVYEPFDLFSAVPLLAGKREGDEISLTVPDRDEPQGSAVVLHVQSADRLMQKGGPSMVPQYRCGAPDRRVTAGVPTARLAVLTSLKLERIGFMETAAGLSDEAACAGAAGTRDVDPDWLEFEVFGPVHYYLMGRLRAPGWQHKIELSQIRRVTVLDRHTLRVQGLERSGGTGLVWAEKHGRPFDMTLDWDGRHLTVRELQERFVRCSGIREPGKLRFTLTPAPLE